MKIAWLVFGVTALALGLVGLIIPLLPTVPLLLLAAFCFSKSSKKLHTWLITHPKLGSPIVSWNESGAINRSSKILATLSIALVFSISFIMKVKVVILSLQAVILCCVLLFIWTRPDK